MSPHRAHRPAFTIVEMLVVVAVIAALLGLLLPALSGARRRAAKTDELNLIRQVGLAWNMYANSNNGASLPGYLSPDVQTRWKVNYEFPGDQDIPQEIAAPWTWRLLPYLEYNHEVVHGYLNEDNSSIQSAISEADEVSLTPAFGYNAYHVGGWWEMEPVEGAGLMARARFSNATIGDRKISAVSRTIGSIRRSTEVAVFCSAALREPGIYKDIDEIYPGWHYVSPPILADDRVWGRPGAGSMGASGGGGGGRRSNLSASARIGGDPTAIEIFSAQGSNPEGISAEPAPAGRYTNQAAVLYADNHTDSQGPATLADQTKWIDAASDPDFTFSP